MNLTLFTTLTIAACGQKGDLVRPLPKEQTVATESEKSQNAEKTP